MKRESVGESCFADDDALRPREQEERQLADWKPV